MSFIPAALLGGALGLFPSSLMLLASFLPICVDMSPLAEASIQNIAAGLIIGAVGMEFFPVIKQSTDEGNIVAVTAGFVVSLLVLLGVERLVSFVSAFPSTAPQQEEAALSETTPLTSGWEAEGIDYASTALTNSCHQQNIRERLCSIQQHVDAVTSRCREFLEDSSPLPIAASELAFEHIDEALHTLHYKIDHAVRLLQGSEYANLMTAASSRHIIQAPSMHRLKPGFKDHGEVQNICNDLQAAAKHIVGHATKSVSSTDLLEVFDHLEELKSAVVNLHGHVESASRKWCRSKPFPNTAPGDFVSIGLTMPVCIDSIVDGFVIGIAASTSVNAGVIMALVNSMEMSFLAIAYSPRVFECTGSSGFVRYASVLLPPALLLTSSIGGGLIGNHASNSHGDLFVAFNTFSAVALLLLACNVLLIEARNTHDSISYPSWWEPAVLVFAGVYLVVVGDCIISSQQ